jgi:hypothetical protein
MHAVSERGSLISAPAAAVNRSPTGITTFAGLGKGATLDAGYKVTGWRDGGAPGKPFVADIPGQGKLSEPIHTFQLLLHPFTRSLALRMLCVSFSLTHPFLSAR